MRWPIDHHFGCRKSSLTSLSCSGSGRVSSIHSKSPSPSVWVQYYRRPNGGRVRNGYNAKLLILIGLLHMILAANKSPHPAPSYDQQNHNLYTLRMCSNPFLCLSPFPFSLLQILNSFPSRYQRSSSCPDSYTLHT